MVIDIKIALLFSLSVIANARSTELMGGHYDNLGQSEQDTSDNKYNVTNSEPSSSESSTEEAIPDPSALIIPGYNLPGHLFNDGKPFYVEKDPQTGIIDFSNKTPAGKDYSSNEYDYIYDEPDPDIFKKSNIDRKDGGYGSHRPNDVNQLSPNFHDFLPIKYNNPEKYAYPLISSSYANTKIQGNVNNYNHKQYSVTTYKPTVSPMYYSTRSVYYNPSTTTTTTTVPTTTTTENKPTNNLMNSPMSHPNYLTTPESEYYDDYYTTQQTNEKEIYLTTEPPKKQIYITNKPSTTKKPYSIFDDLFGDYEEPELIETSKPPFNYDNNKIIVTPASTYKPYTVSTTPSTTTIKSTTKTIVTQSTNKSNSETVSQIFPEDNTMYEYVDDYNNNYNEDASTSHKPLEISTEKSVIINIRNETKPKTTTEKNMQFKPELKQNTTRYSDRFDVLPDITTEKQESNYISITSFNQDDVIPYKTTKAPEKYSPEVTSTKVTSMPLGENHPIRSPSVFSLTDLKESLNREKVETTTNSYIPPPTFEQKDRYSDHKPQIPSTSNIRIAPDQDMVSFVVGNHQNVDAGHYLGTAVKEDTFISNSFRPLYTNQQVIYNRPPKNDTAFINVGTSTSINIHPSQTINVQPIHGSQASLSIGMPADEIKTIPGQVVDEKLDINDNVEFPKEPATKIVFPSDDFTYTPSPNREVLSLYSKPMFHQLPSDLTPPSEPDKKPVRNSGSPRPPWDPRPGHFYQGRPEYARPPRPHKPEVYKRIDGLPNILPQFRPNAKVSNHHYMDSVGTINAGYMPRQPLLDRPSNRPIGFFEKLHPPPPPKHLHNLRNEMKHDRYRYEERILNLPQKNHFAYQMPPKVPITNIKTEDESEIATLQMIQAKQSEKLETIKPNVPPPFKINYQETSEKPLYVVYPVNSAPLKLDVLDTDKKETVVVGTRGEQLPLPPSKITQEFNQNIDQSPVLKLKDRNDDPILKPHSRPNNYPVKSDFPYILEKPDPTLINTPDVVSNIPNNLDISYQSNNQWTSLDTEISATLKTYTEKEKPIAIAYTPTEPTYNRPTYIRPVPELNKYGTVSNDDSEFTVSAVMHTHPQLKLKTPQNEIKYFNPDQKPMHLTGTRKQDNLENHKLNLDVDTTHVPAKLDFQAPFHASVSIDSQYQGWSVVNHKSKSEIDRADVDEPSTTVPETSSEFDIENFKPQLHGGFKPIYSIPTSTTVKNERQE